MIVRFIPFSKRSATVELDYIKLTKPTVVQSKKQRIKSKANQKLVLTKFDPNYVKAADFYKMGFNKSFVSSWFRSKQSVGFITSFESFEQMNLPNVQKELIRPYIDLSRYNTIEKRENKKILRPQKVVVNINEADSVSLKELVGIGNKLSKRIVKYRERLGGFHSLDQLLEVYGITDEVLLKNEGFVSCEGDVELFNVNTIHLNDLKNHPYIDYNFAKKVIAYRDQHGSYHSIDDFKKIYGIDTATIMRIKPYLRFD